jgi:hypothetical protein
MVGDEGDSMDAKAVKEMKQISNRRFKCRGIKISSRASIGIASFATYDIPRLDKLTVARASSPESHSAGSQRRQVVVWWRGAPLSRRFYSRISTLLLGQPSAESRSPAHHQGTARRPEDAGSIPAPATRPRWPQRPRVVQPSRMPVKLTRARKSRLGASARAAVSGYPGLRASPSSRPRCTEPRSSISFSLGELPSPLATEQSAVSLLPQSRSHFFSPSHETPTRRRKALLPTPEELRKRRCHGGSFEALVKQFPIRVQRKMRDGIRLLLPFLVIDFPHAVLPFSRNSRFRLSSNF